MPRKAREKSPESIYHVMCRSNPEILLFRDDDDKDYYLFLLKKYIDKYQCKLYAYCLMDNHVHLHLDPKGFDISKFMHSVNTAYVRYYNKKYSRYGHVFQDRFQSKILNTEAYNFAVSAYTHNNPNKIQGYSGKEENYPYSSYGIYLGLRKDIHNLIDKSFMMGLFNISDEKLFIKRYREFVSHQRDIGSISEIGKLLTTVENVYISGRKVILRDRTPSKVISFIAESLNIKEKTDLPTKSRKTHLCRAFTAYALKVLCGLSYKEICEKMCNITISGCSNLCTRGYELLNNDPVYASLFDQLLCCS